MRRRVVAIVQARMGSTRLPGKVLRRLGNRSVLEWVVRAATAADGVDEVAVATTADSNDDAIATAGAELGIRVVRGSGEDVLGRYLAAVDATDADAVVRLTADCPLLDPAVISQVVAVWRADCALDYVSTTQVRSLPRGLDVELATASALRQVNARPEPHHHAHVTSGLYEREAGYLCSNLAFTPRCEQYRVTLDTEADAALLDALVAELPDAPPSWRDLVTTLAERPDIALLNAHVEQNPLTEG